MSRIKKALTATMSLTIMLFGFIIFLLYVIYCYAYYDKYLEFEYTNKVNNHEYNFVYDKMVGKGKLTFEQFTSVIDKMNNKDKLVNIFETYYKDSGMYNKKSFLDTYFYNIDNVVEEDIKFSVNGKTNLFTRRAIFYDEIKISNKNSSTNLGVLTTCDSYVEFDSAVRSSVPSLKKEIELRIKTITEILGAEFSSKSDYPGWEYDPNSKMREICQKVYKDMTGKEAKIVAIHAGVECGLFNEKLGNLDMISFGPNLYDVHTPQEHMSITSVKNTWDYLLKVLEVIK
jgi:acetylornithine deacetylase/succinyl-diaminopimelate desuccinylase-like protein